MGIKSIQAISILLFYFLLVATLNAQTKLDFGSAVGFSKPLNVSVYRLAGGANEDFVIFPNRLTVVSDVLRGKKVSLIRNGHESGYFTAVARLDFDPDVEEAKTELVSKYPTAKFHSLDPIKTDLIIQGSGGVDVVFPYEFGPSASALYGNYPFSFPVKGIFYRALTAPNSYKSDMFTVILEFTVSGEISENNGQIRAVERKFRIGSSFKGFCAVLPDRVYDLATGRQGCVHPKYPHYIIIRMQHALQDRGFAPGPLDGIYGPLTEGAIRRAQNEIGVIVDGIPTSDLLFKLRSLPDGG